MINFAAVFVDHLRQQHPGSTGCFDEKLLLLILNERIILFYSLTKDAFHYYSITDNEFLYFRSEFTWFNASNYLKAVSTGKDIYSRE